MATSSTATANKAMRPEEKQREYDATLLLIYTELEKILEKRPKNPVSAFASRYAY